MIKISRYEQYNPVSKQYYLRNDLTRLQNDFIKNKQLNQCYKVVAMTINKYQKFLEENNTLKGQNQNSIQQQQ